MDYMEIETPAMLIDREIMMDNLRFMQAYADKHKVALRPHTKTHKTPALALIQESAGARGITVAKTGEALVMAENGLKDIFIANEIVGEEKLRRIIAMMRDGVKVTFGLDSMEQADIVERVFKTGGLTAQILVEIEVGENRSGIIEEEDFRALLIHIKESCGHIHFQGVFSHDGHSYNAKDLEECRRIHLDAQKRTLAFAEAAEDLGMKAETVSIGSTPSLMHDFPILEGITEIRPGTYILMDASQAQAYGSFNRCAASVLATVISRPTSERVILDVGAKGITMQTRTEGICAVTGLGFIKQFPGVTVYDVYDEHAIIYSREMHDNVRVGDKVEIIPVHICPVMNLYDEAFLVSGKEVVERLPVLCRGKLR